MSAAPDLHQDWQNLLDFARARGWSADLTDNGFVRFERAGSVVFGPNMSAPLDVLRECAKRLVKAGRYADAAPYTTVLAAPPAAQDRPPQSLTVDDVVWWPEEGRWVGRTSPHLTKRARREAEEAAEFSEKANDG